MSDWRLEAKRYSRPTTVCFLILLYVSLYERPSSLIIDCSLTFANLIIANNRSISFLRFTVSFLQKRSFPLKAGGSPASLAVKTWQYLLKIRVLGFVFAFRCDLLCIFSRISGRVCAVVCASVFAATMIIVYS